MAKFHWDPCETRVGWALTIDLLLNSEQKLNRTPKLVQIFYPKLGNQRRMKFIVLLILLAFVAKLWLRGFWDISREGYVGSCASILSKASGSKWNAEKLNIEPRFNGSISVIVLKLGALKEPVYRGRTCRFYFIFSKNETSLLWPSVN